MQGMIGKKLGTTQVYSKDGELVPVTAVQVGPCVVLQVKTKAKDGYVAAQLGMGEQKEHRSTKARLGHCKASKALPPRILKEVRLEKEDEVKAGDVVTAGQVFKDGDFVDVIGTTKGRGFQGVVKRHGFGGGPAAHGSMFHRRTGSIGMRERPGRILKNKRLPGHMGNARRTIQNLKVVQVRAEDHVLLLRGAVPGPQGGMVLVRKAIKKAAKQS